MKTIKTLIDDLYNLFSKDVVATEEQVEELGRDLTDMLKRRLSSPPEPRGLSMSNFGSKCKRQLWYRINKPELAEPLHPQTKMNFLSGDIWDTIMPHFVRWSGHKVEGEQTQMNLHGLKGHRDCVIDGVTVDVKTANSRSVQKFKKHSLQYDDPFGYLDQLHLYTAAGHDDPAVVGKREGAFLVIDKERGGLTLDRYVFGDRDFKKEIEEVNALLSADEPPKRGYNPVPDGSSGNLVIPMPCRYCAYKEECWKDSNKGKGLRKFIFSTGPKWFVRIFREPRVEEITE